MTTFGVEMAFEMMLDRIEELALGVAELSLELADIHAEAAEADGSGRAASDTYVEAVEAGLTDDDLDEVRDVVRAAMDTVNGEAAGAGKTHEMAEKLYEPPRSQTVPVDQPVRTISFEDMVAGREKAFNCAASHADLRSTVEKLTARLSDEMGLRMQAEGQLALLQSRLQELEAMLLSRPWRRPEETTLAPTGDGDGVEPVGAVAGKPETLDGAGVAS